MGISDRFRKKETEKLSPADELVKEGASLVLKKRYEEAISCLDKALEINPRHYKAWFLKGMSLGDLGKIEEAIGCYDRALEINLWYPEAWMFKIRALEVSKRYLEAISCANNFAEIAQSKGDIGFRNVAEERIRSLGQQL